MSNRPARTGSGGLGHDSPKCRARRARACLLELAGPARSPPGPAHANSGLRTAPRIFNLFAEALHWVLETLHEWNVTHYLDDFLCIFPPNSNTESYSVQFDETLSAFGLTKAVTKDTDGCVVIHLGFEFGSNTMEVQLPQNKKQWEICAVDNLLCASHVSLTTLETTLGFLSHCCQVVPLG